MTKQEYYDLLVKSASDGTFPSYVGGDDGCLYRKDQTPACKCRCAAGLLIPDEQYDPAMEGRFVSFKAVRSAISIPDGMTFEDLCVVQRTHDRIACGWDGTEFVETLDLIPCFADVTRAKPTSDTQSGTSDEPPEEHGLR